LITKFKEMKMSQTTDFQAIAGGYAQAVRAYFEPVNLPKSATAERGEALRQMTAQQQVTAEKALSHSKMFNDAATGVIAKKHSADVQLRALAKLATDLEVARDLLQASEEQAVGTLSAQGAAERALSSRASVERELAIVEGTADRTTSTERGAKIVSSVAMGKAELSSSVGNVLFLIPDRSLALSNKIVEKVFDFGMANLAQGAGKVIEIAAGFLNQTENLNKLIDLGRRFLKSAYDLAMSLLGKVGLDVIKEKITSWVDDKLQNREQLMSKWLKDLYGVDDTAKAIQQKIEGSEAALAKYGTAIDEVDKLNDTYGKCTDVLDKGLGTVGFLRGLAVFKSPEGLVALTGVMLLLMGVVVMTGAALLDSPQVKALRQVRGVSDIVASSLS
jgi:hypothetical protein